MPEFRDINFNGLEIKTYPEKRWRRPIKNIIPYYLGNTAKFEIYVRRDSETAPELWRVRLFENIPTDPKSKMNEWFVSENTNITEWHKVSIERYLDCLGEKRIILQYDGRKETIITIDVLSKEQIRLSLLCGVFLAVLTWTLAIISGFIKVEPFINISR